MQLTALIDLNDRAGQAGADIPCREYDAELWFAESPADVEFVARKRPRGRPRKNPVAA